MNRKSSTPIDDDDRLTPKEERHLTFSIAQSKAGLTYGPFENGGLSLRSFMKARERTRRVSIRIPEILFKHLQTGAKRFDLRPGELIATILQTHQFKSQDCQLIVLAVDAAAPTKRKRRRAERRQV